MKRVLAFIFIISVFSCNEVPDYETLHYVGTYEMTDLSISYKGLEYGTFIEWPDQIFGTKVNIHPDYTYSYDSASRFFSFVMESSSIKGTELFGVYYLKDAKGRTNNEDILYMPLNENVIFVNRNENNAVFSFRSHDTFNNSRDYMFFRYCGYKYALEMTTFLNNSTDTKVATAAGEIMGFYEGYRDRYIFLDTQTPNNSLDPLKSYTIALTYHFKQRFTNQDPKFIEAYNAGKLNTRDAGAKLAEELFTIDNKSLDFKFHFNVY